MPNVHVLVRSLSALALAGAGCVPLDRQNCAADDDCTEIFGESWRCGEAGFCDAPATADGDCPTMVCDHMINIGNASVQSGPTQHLGQGMVLGTRAALFEANAEGGVDGRQLNLIVRDDEYEPNSHEVEMHYLTDPRSDGLGRRVLAVIGNVGTPTANVGVPIAIENDTVLHGLFTGAGLLRKDPPDRVVFNFRASYVQETVRMVNYFTNVRDPELRIPPPNVGAFPQGCSKAGGDGTAAVPCPYDGSEPEAQGREDALDAFGLAGWAGITKGLADLHNIPKAEIPLGTYQRNTENITAARDHFITTWLADPTRAVEQPPGVVRVVIIAVPTAAPTAALIVKLTDDIVEAKAGRQPSGLTLTDEQLTHLSKVDLLVASVSFVGSDALRELLLGAGGGDYCTNTFVSQVIPFPLGASVAAQEFQDVLERYADANQISAEPGFVSFEGYLQARLFVDALRSAPSLDTDGLVDGFHSLNGLDYGIGTELSFSPSDHQASDKTWGTELDADCQWREIEFD
jgi:ABC-type branched-subunit amino acid transport system substrate-binding protein